MFHNTLHFNSIHPFDMKLSYVDIDSESPLNINDSHTHRECEIYINLSGDVSFMVENRIYPLRYGNIVVTRPYEYHHCIYHSNSMHKHFWILFSSDNNENLLDVFFNRISGENNLLSLPPDETEELISVCFGMSRSLKSQTEQYMYFFKLMSLLEKASGIMPENTLQHSDINFALNYMLENFMKKISVHDIANHAHVSINTLERHFNETIGITPARYLKKLRFANAAKLLSKNFSVTEACEKSGFSDYSTFIASFKKMYGMTPLKYKKTLTK